MSEIFKSWFSNTKEKKNCVRLLEIHKGCVIVKKMVSNVRIKVVLYTNDIN